MIEQLTDWIKENRQITGISKRLRNLSFMQMSVDLSEFSKIFYFIFKNSDIKPYLFAKMTRTAKYNYLIEKEFFFLSQLIEQFPSDLIKSIPKPIALVDIGNHLIFLEEAVPGISLNNILKKEGRKSRNNRKIIEYLSNTCDWLYKFQQLTKVGEFLIDSDWLDENILRTIDVFSNYYLLSKKEESYLKDLYEKAVDLKGRKIDLVCSHGDFWVGNILVSNGMLKIIDWGAANRGFLPFYDFYMFFYTTFNILNECLTNNIQISRSLQDLKKRYLRKINTDKESHMIFFPVFLMKRAVQSYAIYNSPNPHEEQFRNQISVLAEGGIEDVEI
jgi:hypothetical protein